MTTIELDGTKTLDLLRKIVEEYGASTSYAERYREITGEEPPHMFNDPDEGFRCEYRTADRSQPLCIVGVLFDKIGYQVPAEAENDSARNLVRTVRRSVPGAQITDDAMELMIAAQASQDNGDLWGEALQAAEDLAAQLGHLY